MPGMHCKPRKSTLKLESQVLCGLEWTNMHKEAPSFKLYAVLSCHLSNAGPESISHIGIFKLSTSSAKGVWTYHMFWNFGMVRVLTHEHWCICRSKVVDHWQWHVERTMQGWSWTLIHLHMCNGWGQHKPKSIFVQSNLCWIFKLSISVVQRGLESATHFETLEGHMGIRVIYKVPQRWTKSWFWSFFEKTFHEELTSASCFGASSFHLSNFEKILRSKKGYVHAPRSQFHINLCKASLAHPS